VNDNAIESVLGALKALDTSHVSGALDKLRINGQCAGLLPYGNHSLQTRGA
jgi:hypothetical protein